MAAKKTTKQAPKYQMQQKPLVLLAREPIGCRRCGGNCTCTDEELDAGGPAYDPL